MLVLSGACGRGGDNGGAMDHGGGQPAAPATADRTVAVEMMDISFQPDRLEVGLGQSVRFTFHNGGKVDHEAVFGDEGVQTEHEKTMKDASGPNHGSSEMTVVKPGGSADMTYRFDKAGTILIGCHQPGHYAAGMKVTVAVA